MYCREPNLHVIPGCFCFVKYCPEIYNSSGVAGTGTELWSLSYQPKLIAINSSLTSQQASGGLSWPSKWGSAVRGFCLSLGGLDSCLTLQLEGEFGSGFNPWTHGKRRSKVCSQRFRFLAMMPLGKGSQALCGGGSGGQTRVPLQGDVGSGQSRVIVIP